MEQQSILTNLIKTLENLLFAMPIPDDIVAKYNIIKESACKKALIEFTPITKKQYPAIGIKPTKNEYGGGEPYIKKINDLKSYTDTYFKDIAKRITHTLSVINNSEPAPSNIFIQLNL